MDLLETQTAKVILSILAGALGGAAAGFWRTSSKAFLQAVQQKYTLFAQRERAADAASLEELRTSLKRETENERAERDQQFVLFLEDFRRTTSLEVESLRASLTAKGKELEAIAQRRARLLENAFPELAQAISSLRGPGQQRAAEVIRDYSTTKAYLVPRQIAAECANLISALNNGNHERQVSIQLHIEELMRAEIWGDRDGGYEFEGSSGDDVKATFSTPFSNEMDPDE